MDLTLGDADNIDADSVEIVVERVRQQLESGIQSRLDQTTEELELALQASRLAEIRVQASIAERKRLEDDANFELRQVQARLLQLHNRAESQERALKAGALKTSRVIVTSFLSVIAVSTVAVVCIQFLRPEWLKGLPTWAQWLVPACLVCVMGLGALRHVIGGSVKDWLKPVEKWLEKEILSRNRRRAGLVATE